MTHQRGRPWRPKKEVKCERCKWKGRRGSVHAHCPKCGFWYPKPIYYQKAVGADDCQSVRQA